MDNQTSRHNIEPELTSGTPRPFSFRLGPRIARMLPLFFGGVLILLGGLLFSESQALARLAQRGKPATAQVTGRRVYGARSPDHYLDFTFVAGGRTIAGSQSVSHEVYERYPPGSAVTITYLPDSPDVQRIGTVDRARARETQDMGLGVLSILTLFFAGLSLYVERFFRQQLFLLRRGTPAVGTMLRVTIPPPGSRMQYYTFTYEYEVPGVGTLQKTVTSDGRAGPQLADQETATVLYDPKKPQRSHLYAALAAGAVLKSKASGGS